MLTLFAYRPPRLEPKSVLANLNPGLKNPNPIQTGARLVIVALHEEAQNPPNGLLWEQMVEPLRSLRML